MSLSPAQRIARDRTRLLGFPRPGRRAIVVGGGPMAARRAAALTRAATPVTVFAPVLCDDVFDLLAERLVTWENRWPVAADLTDAWLVHAATGDQRDRLPGVRLGLAAARHRLTARVDRARGRSGRRRLPIRSRARLAATRRPGRCRRPCRARTARRSA